MLSFMDEHRCADTFSDSNSSFGTDNVDTIGVIVGLRLCEELYVGMDAVLEAERGVSAFTQYKSGISIVWMDPPGYV